MVPVIPRGSQLMRRQTKHQIYSITIDWIVWEYIGAPFTQHGELPGGGDA